MCLAILGEQFAAVPLGHLLEADIGPHLEAGGQFAARRDFAVLALGSPHALDWQGNRFVKDDDIAQRLGWLRDRKICRC